MYIEWMLRSGGAMSCRRDVILLPVVASTLGLSVYSGIEPLNVEVEVYTAEYQKTKYIVSDFF